MTKQTSLAIIVRERIKQFRLRSDLTQEELSELAGISVDAITRIETGSRTPTLDTLEKIANALAIHVTDLFETRHAPSRKVPPAIERVLALLRPQPAHVQEAAAVIVAALAKACRGHG